MSPRRPQQRRVNKHVKTLHCECGHRYTRADFYERHLQTTGHNSEFVAVSYPTPDPASNSRHFYCSCGSSYTAAHAFHAHCKRTGHVGDWSRSKYQPKGHDLTIAGTDLASAYGELSTASEPAFSRDQLTELSKFQESQPTTNSFKTDESRLVPLIGGKEADTFNEADIQESLLSEGSLNDNDIDTAEVDLDHRQVNAMDTMAASPPMTCASLSHNSASLTDTSDVTDTSNSSVRILNENNDTASNGTLLPSRTFAKIIGRTTHDRTGPLPRDIDATDLNARIANLRHMSRQKGGIFASNLIKISSSHAAQSLITTISGKEEAMPNLGSDWRSHHTDTLSKRLRGPFKAGVRKIGTSFCTLGKWIAEHKGRLAAALLSAAVFTAAVQSLQIRPLLSDTTPRCPLDWGLDLDGSTHVVKDSGFYSNVDSAFCSHHSDARATKRSQWTGTISFVFKDGSMLKDEDVLYNANAHINIVSLPKLNEAGVLTDFNVTRATVYNASNDGPVGRATVREHIFSRDDLHPPPPPATYYPSRSTLETADPGSTPQNQSRMGSLAIVPRSGVFSFIDSTWSPPCKFLPFVRSTSETTTCPPFESAPEAAATVVDMLKEPTAWDTTWPTTSQAASPTSSMALPFDAAARGSNLELNSSTSPIPVLKRKSSNHLDRSEKPPRKQPRCETGVDQRIGRQMRGLRGVFAGMTKTPRASETAHLQNGLDSAQYETPNGTPTIPSLTNYPSSATSVKEHSAGAADDLGKRPATCLSQWNLPIKVSGLCTRLDARDHALKQRAEMEFNESESRLDLKKKMKRLEGHAWSPCEQCQKCSLF